jgi:hypothetical protein
MYMDINNILREESGGHEEREEQAEGFDNPESDLFKAAVGLGRIGNVRPARQDLRNAHPPGRVAAGLMDRYPAYRFTPALTVAFGIIIHPRVLPRDRVRFGLRRALQPQRRRYFNRLDNLPEPDNRVARYAVIGGLGEDDLAHGGFLLLGIIFTQVI